MREDVKNNIEKALILRKENKLSYKEISEKMDRPIGTIARWLAPFNLELPIEIKNLKKKIALNASLKMQKGHSELRKKFYEEAKKNAKNDLKDISLRDFINIYIGEGFKRSNCEISVVNSDPKIILLSLFVMKKYFLNKNKKLNLDIRYYSLNDNKNELINYWSNLTKNDNSIVIKTYVQPTVKLTTHNNSNKFGLVAVRIFDTYAKQKLNAYIDYLKEEWTEKFENAFNIKVDRTITEVKAQITEPSEVVKSEEHTQNYEIEYPNLKKLKKMVEEKGYVQVGKELGCSDVAVRKHILSRTKKSVPYPPMPILKQMVAEKGYSGVARELGCNLESVRKHILKNDIAHIPVPVKKILYPGVPDLISMVEEKGYLQVSKELGCSDNAIRKYLKSNNIDLKTITRTKTAPISHANN